MWAVLCAVPGPVTVRDVARWVGSGRESAGRVLGQLEAVGWVARVRGDAAAAEPDLWFAVEVAKSSWLAATVSGIDVGSTGPECAPAVGEAHEHAALPVLEKLHSGRLTELVAQLLGEHPDEEFGPVQVARMLGGRSPGAVANSLGRLVTSGRAWRTCEAPSRYQAVRRTTG